MKKTALTTVALLQTLACAKGVEPAAPVETQTEAAPEAVPKSNLEGTWYDNFREAYVFKADGTVENRAFESATLKTVATCTESGFDISACAEPRFLWRPHPTESEAFLFAIRIPLTRGATHTQQASCFCLPDPGLPMLAQLNGDKMEVNTVGPDGQVLPSSGYTLTRETPAP
jgi:hypothetical protein